MIHLIALAKQPSALELVNESDRLVLYGVYSTSRLGKTRMIEADPDSNWSFIKPHSTVAIKRPPFRKSRSHTLLVVVPSQKIEQEYMSLSGEEQKAYMNDLLTNLVPIEYRSGSYLDSIRAIGTTKHLFKEQGFGAFNRGWDYVTIRVVGKGADQQLALKTEKLVYKDLEESQDLYLRLEQRKKEIREIFGLGKDIPKTRDELIELYKRTYQQAKTKSERERINAAYNDLTRLISAGRW